MSALDCHMTFRPRSPLPSHPSLVSQNSRGADAGVAAQSSEATGPSHPRSDSPPPGTFRCFVRKHLSWPLRVTRAACSAPGRLCGGVRAAAHALAGHVLDNAQDYAALYELLSVSVPLLLVLQEVLLQVYAETLPDESGSIRPLLGWLHENLGHRLM